jgi:hypothetical protein
MYRQSKQDKIAKDVKKLVLGKSRYHDGNWSFAGFKVTKTKSKVRKPLIDIKTSKGERGATNISIDYPDSWRNPFKKKSPAKKAIRIKVKNKADFIVDSKGNVRRNI